MEAVAADNREQRGQRALARGGALNLGGAAATAVANFLIVMVVTRSTSAGLAGALFAATSVAVMLGAVARLGTTTGLVYWIARLRALGRPNDVRRALSLALLPVLFLGVVCAGALLWLADPLGRMIGDEWAGEASAFLRQLGILLPAIVVNDAIFAATRGFSTMRPTASLDLVLRPVLQLALTVAAVLSGRFEMLALAWALPYALSALMGAFWLVRLVSRLPKPVDTGAPRLAGREFWRYTGPRAVSTIVQLALQRLDIVLVAALRGPADAAVYTAATRFLVVGQLVSKALSTAAQPSISALVAVGKRSEAGQTYQTATGWLVLVAWPLYLIMFGFAPELMQLFGDGYGQGATVLRVLSAAMLFATASGMVDGMLNMAGKTTWTLVNSSLALVTMLVIDLALIPGLGAVGAAIGWAAAIVVNNAIPLVQLWRAFGLHPFGVGARTAMGLASVTIGMPVLVMTAAGTSPTLRIVIVGIGVLLMIAASVRRADDLQLDSFHTLLARRAGRTPRSESGRTRRGTSEGSESIR